MLSQRSRYALRALVYLAGRAEPGPAAIGEIAEASAAPRKFLEAILLELKRRQILVSVRGRSGGYALARPASEISFADVIRVLDGPLALAPCASKTAYRPCDTCPTVTDCPAHPALVAARDAVAAVLEGWSIEKAVLAVSPLEAL
ncbi:MAG: Rrf2 family transcriptional regulator [Phenylobacterium sp.]|uniref:RrF2 family transcriptional regulator n=1 Tax=Phenylobacterium sp. TaxID=1871053 RepID=UPI002736B5BF|nr:Rrf2 family transcriptional regulator [Phenylobacterium sp.]MDP3749778.1 Rrf2 family transcriptional regulator [Phenylobacterium sp.]